jgi:hypothetical protein
MIMVAVIAGVIVALSVSKAVDSFRYPKKNPNGPGWIQRDGGWSATRYPDTF